MNCFDRDNAVFVVLTNHEGEHALWPQWKAVPAGWMAMPDSLGDKASALARVERAWTEAAQRDSAPLHGLTLEVVVELDGTRPASPLQVPVVNQGLAAGLTPPRFDVEAAVPQPA